MRNFVVVETKQPDTHRNILITLHKHPKYLAKGHITATNCFLHSPYTLQWAGTCPLKIALSYWVIWPYIFMYVDGQYRYIVCM